MDKKLKLTKIILETKDGKTVELSMDEAKELHDQLHTLFGEKTTYIPSNPIYIERDRLSPYYQQTWCGGGGTAKQLTSNLMDVYCSVTGNSGLEVSYIGAH